MEGKKNLKRSAKFFVNLALALQARLRLAVNRSPKLLILTYHRVLPLDHPERKLEQPGMVVSPEVLNLHIQYMKRIGADIIHLDEWLDRKNHSSHLLKPLSVAFTFDDGWQDNYQYAYPVLKRERIPATVFLVTKLIDTPETFWPEKVIELLQDKSLNYDSPELQWLKPHLGQNTAILTEGLTVSPEDADPIIRSLKSLDDETILDNLMKTQSINNSTENTHARRAILSSAEVAEMAEDGQIKFGAHTRNHFRLNLLKSAAVLSDQIVGCLEDLRKLPSAGIPIFCYPNGNESGASQDLVRRHYTAACTTRTGWNSIEHSDFALKRMNLHDGNSSSHIALLATIGRGLLGPKRL